MKIRIFLMGVLLIIGAVSEYLLTPVIIDKVNNITNIVEAKIIPTMSNSPQNQAYASMMTDANTKTSQFTSSMTMLEKKVTTYTSWGSALMGVGYVAYGILAKNNTRMKSSNSEALDILKTRLAKGEITKRQFDHLKNDIV